MNNRNINAAGKPQTIRTAMEKLAAASRRRCQLHRTRSLDSAFRNHIKTFANSNVCYAAVNGISIPVPLC